MPEDEDSTKTAEFPAYAGPPSRPARSVRVEIGAMSHAGRVRPNNEDHFLVVQFARSMALLQTNLPEGDLPAWSEETGYAMAVADGMGGAAAGERASALALRTGIRLVLDSEKWFFKIDEREARELVVRLRESFREVDRILIEQAQVDRRLAGMGTTLTAAYSVGPDAFVVHAGDSRAYLFRAGILSQLTRDHTIAQSLVDAGLIRPEQAATHARRHALTNYVGGAPFGLEPEVSAHRLADGDRLLLCSDGLTEMLDDRAIADALRRHDEPQAACRALIALALDRGGRDNVTVILARYAIPGERIGA